MTKLKHASRGFYDESSSEEKEENEEYHTEAVPPILEQLPQPVSQVAVPPESINETPSVEDAAPSLAIISRMYFKSDL